MKINEVMFFDRLENGIYPENYAVFEMMYNSTHVFNFQSNVIEIKMKEWPYKSFYVSDKLYNDYLKLYENNYS